MLLFNPHNCSPLKITWGSLFFALKIAFLCQFARIAEAQINDELLSRFKEEAPPAWEECERQRRQVANRQLRWRLEITESYGPAPGKLRTVRNFMRLGNEGEFRLSRWLWNDKGFEQVIGKNNDYSFELRRPIDEEIWSMVELEPLESKEIQPANSNVNVGMSVIGFSQQLPGSVAYWAKANEIPRWHELPDLIIKRVSFVDYEGKQCIEVDLTFTEPGKLFFTLENGASDKYIPRIVASKHVCTAVFSPEDYWLLQRVEGHVTGEPSDPNQHEYYIVEKKYDYELGGVPFLTSEIRTMPNNEAANMRWTQNYSDDVSIEDFRVSGYGLPEPEWYSPPINWRRILFYVALSVIGLLVLFHIAKRFLNRN